MDQRVKLGDALTAFRPNVYYQPPSTVRMTYPCIRYTFEGFGSKNANDKKYLLREHYQAIDMYYDPDDHKRQEILAAFEYVTFGNTYTADGLHHDVYEIYL